MILAQSLRGLDEHYVSMKERGLYVDINDKGAAHSPMNDFPSANVEPFVRGLTTEILNMNTLLDAGVFATARRE